MTTFICLNIGCKWEGGLYDLYGACPNCDAPAPPVYEMSADHYCEECRLEFEAPSIFARALKTDGRLCCPDCGAWVRQKTEAACAHA